MKDLFKTFCWTIAVILLVGLGLSVIVGISLLIELCPTPSPVVQSILVASFLFVLLFIIVHLMRHPSSQFEGLLPANYPSSQFEGLLPANYHDDHFDTDPDSDNEDELPHGVDAVCESCGEPCEYDSEMCLCNKCQDNPDSSTVS